MDDWGGTMIQQINFGKDLWGAEKREKLSDSHDLFALFNTKYTAETSRAHWRPYSSVK